MSMRLQALQYSAGQYSKAQQMRRDGVGPSSMGIADDLPTRMAYENLNTLAGMAGKVRALPPTATHHHVCRATLAGFVTPSMHPFGWQGADKGPASCMPCLHPSDRMSCAAL
jgi:hypothetical protein